MGRRKRRTSSESPNDAVLPPVRVQSALLAAARAVADLRDETLAQVVRRALREYVASAPSRSDVVAVVSSSVDPGSALPSGRSRVRP
jgi:hypothetical protein